MLRSRNLAIVIIFISGALLITFFSGCDTIISLGENEVSPTITPRPTMKSRPTREPTIDPEILPTIEAYRDSPPVGYWCTNSNKDGIRICVGEIHYLENIGDIKAPSNARFLVAIISIYNLGQVDKTINPSGISLVQHCAN